MKITWRSILLRSLIVLVGLLGSFFSGGCSPAYVLQAAVGQYRMVNRSIPVEEALQKDSLSLEQKERLQLVAQIKAFGEQELQLKPTRNYETVYLESGRRPLYIVLASPKDRLLSVTWWFPVVGRVPYLGYFKLEKAQAKKRKLLQKDLDVMLGMAEAYSTLGWFQDPVTLNLLDGPAGDMVETILHELTHSTLYVKGQGEFNEGFAMLVGLTGARLFLESRLGFEHPLALRAREQLEDQHLFAIFLDKLLVRLEALYGSSLSYREKIQGRQQVFSEALAEFAILKRSFRTDHFSRFDQAEWNNATLLAFGLYHRHFPLFEQVLRRHNHSLPETIRFLRELAGREEDLLAALGRWMEEHPS